jgi:dCMP deaminase
MDPNPYHKPAGHYKPEKAPEMPKHPGNRFRLMFGLPLLPEPENTMNKRISKIEYAMRIAEAAACRSEDPFYQVGAAAMSEDGRIIATGYNGLPPGVQASPSWWNDKEKRKPYVLHAETNLCSMFKRGEVQAVCVTLMPCPDCMRVLAAHGVKEVYFRKHHEASHDSVGLAQFWGIKMQWLDGGNQKLEPPNPHRNLNDPDCFGSVLKLSPSARAENCCEDCPSLERCRK